MTLAHRYYLSMLGLSATHFVVVGTYSFALGNLDDLGFALLANLTVLVGLNLFGSRYLFRPIQRFLDGGGDAETARRRIENLTVYSVAWGVFLVLGVVSFALFVVQPYCRECDPLAMLPFRASMVVLFGTFCGSFLFFIIGDFVSLMRAELSPRINLAVRARQSHLGHKYIVAVLAIGVVPAAFAYLESIYLRDLWPLMGLDPDRALATNMIVVLQMAAAAYFFIRRSFRRPIQSLLQAVGRIDRGDLTRKAPVMTSDEIGVLTTSLNRMVDGLSEQAFLRETFGRYIPESVAQAILANRGVLRPQQRVATVLFTDIAGFTTLCERVAPETVVTMLNDYFSALTEIVHRHGGVVTQFQGDAMLVVFNVPLEDRNHARNAIRAGLEILDATGRRTFGDSLKLPTRIGINTGPVVAGPVGAGDRLSYTVHGDSVNLAARLEQANKEFGTGIIVSEVTRLAAGDGFDYEPLGDLAIRGKTATITAYSVRPCRDTAA
ncbi:MAG: HAMP domain-containing protein [Rhodospirillales bacterium]|nr:HAMP domain-containing protein [Rhodospirillales bacterium]